MRCKATDKTLDDDGLKHTGKCELMGAAPPGGCLPSGKLAFLEALPSSCGSEGKECTSTMAEVMANADSQLPQKASSRMGSPEPVFESFCSNATDKSDANQTSVP
jgi:hypothetical protein